MFQSHIPSRQFSLVIQGAKTLLIMLLVLLMIGSVIGYLSPASGSLLFGWTRSTAVQTPQGPSDLRPVSAVQQVIPLTVKSGVFNPSTISIYKNNSVILELKSEDREYSFFLPSKDLHIQFGAKTPASVQLIFDKDGTYPFASSIYAPGYEATQGVIVVGESKEADEFGLVTTPTPTSVISLTPSQTDIFSTSPSPTSSPVPKTPTPGSIGSNVELCREVFADSSGRQPATAALQSCVDRTDPGGILEIPSGTYLMDSQLRLLRSITLRTKGTSNSTTSCMHGLPCATFKASPTLFVENGFVTISGERVQLEHLVLDGNRTERLNTAAANQCANNRNRFGFNATAHSCVNCSLIFSASINALCGTGFEWRGDGATIRNSIFRDNGENSRHMMWADGLTLLQSDGAVVRNNEFIDNSDIGFISGGARKGVFIDNVVLQSNQLAFGGLMLDNFNGNTHGDFDGARLSNNRVDCAQQKCDYGIVVGPHAWYPSDHIRGGEVSGNTVLNAKIGMVVSGAGRPDAPVVIFGNTISGSPSSATFLCGIRPSANYVFSPGSMIDTKGTPPQFSEFPVTNCP